MGFFRDKAAEFTRDIHSTNPADQERAADTLVYVLKEGAGDMLENMDALTRAIKENKKNGK
ncbi:hypothetical protein C5L38_33730 (plasmid) [Streptomyces sp. WAC00288]|uniref:hypothetical protein n=1 Tax=unclassified Streptomyces TaxID=2593676 RepID=UPI0007880458|nr:MULTISPECIES: hypothetical protein [unclassified Streptomyces]AVI00044.1 hypothetical protein C5L38_33730 [Streptomyces sp. WAC00288]KYG51108.1 hypothetical protein AWI43_32155 [Streptomyces sp. WAC04657]